MKLNTMQKLYRCIKFDEPEIHLSKEIIDAARKPIDRMLEISKKAKLIK
jgi:quinolinate synthase